MAERAAVESLDDGALYYARPPHWLCALRDLARLSAPPAMVTACGEAGMDGPQVGSPFPFALGLGFSIPLPDLDL